MSTHFQWTFRPITAVAAIFGLALIEYPLGKPRRFLSLIYAPFAISMEIVMFRRYTTLQLKSIVSVNSFMYIIMLCCICIIIVSICLIRWHGKRYYKCLERLNEVDETLRALGIETDHTKLRRIGILVLIIWVMMYFIAHGYSCIQYIRLFGDERTALLKLSLVMPQHARMLTDMQFWSVLGYAGTRFDYFSNALRKLTIDENNRANFRNSKLISVRGVFIPDERTKRMIWTIMHLHFELCKILRDINRVFEVQMSFQMACDIVLLLYSIVFIFRIIFLPYEIGTFKMILLICLWAAPPLLDIIITNHLCETVGGKARNVCDMAVELLRIMDDEGMREDVSFIVLQTKLRPLKFTCMGLYYFGYDLMFTIFGTVVTIAVILLQFNAKLDF